MSLSVIVVSYRRADQLRRCLDSLRTHLPGVPVTVWDNASDGTPAVRDIVDGYPDVTWIFSPTNVGFGAAVNAVVEGMADDTDLLLLNQDAELTGDLDRSRAALAIPRVAAVAPRGEPGPNGQVEDVAHRPLTLARAMVSEAGFGPRLRGTRVSDLYPTSSPAHVDGYLGGACLFLRRAAWDELGGFDPSFVFYGEEADWQRRAVAAGWTLRLADETGYRHAAGGSVADDADLTRRSRDLLHEAQAHRLHTTGNAHRADAFAAAVGVLERVQRSKRISRPGSSRRPPVVFSTNTLGVGGAERLQVQLAGALASRGHDVTVVCLQSFGPLVTQLAPAVRVVRRPWWAPAAVPVRGPAVLFSNETNTEAGFATLWRAGARDRRWFVAGHTPVRPDGPTYSRALTAALRRADGFVVLAESQWTELARQHDLGTRHIVIPNGVPTAPAQPAVGDADPIRIGMIARITEAKNPQLLTAALAALADLDWTLDIWGDGPDRARLESLTPATIRDRVRWHGWSDHSDAALAELDLLAVPSRAEVFPMVILEAMARGVPVVASAVAAIPEMLDHGRAGVLVQPITAAAWAAALLDLLGDRPRMRGLASAGRARQQAHYTLDGTVDRYEELIEKAGP